MLKNNLFLGILILILLAGNIYLSVKYIGINKQLQQLKNQQSADTVSTRAQTFLVLKEYLNVVLNTATTTSSDDRVKLENDIRQLQDTNITTTWNAFVSSKNVKTSQANALKLIGLLEDKIGQ